MKHPRNQIVFHLSRALRNAGYKFRIESDPHVIEMRETLESMGKNDLTFKIDYYPDGNWSAECIEIDGIMTGGNDAKTATHMIKDAIFTYFEIPPHLCHDLPLRADNEPVKVSQVVHVGA